MANPYQELSYKIKDEKGNEDDNEDETLAEQHYKKQTAAESKALDGFLENVKYICDKKDPDKNIWEQAGKMRCFNFPKEVIAKFFNYYDLCRIAGVPLYFTEKQNKESSGIRYDLDILQDEKHNRSLLVNEIPFQKFATKFANLFKEIFIMPPTDFTAHIMFSFKPGVVFQEKDKKYKDGVHIDIPSLQISRKAKRFLLYCISEKKILTDCFGKDYDKIADPELFMDKQSCHVPLLLYGSTKAGVKTPYKLRYAYKIIFESSSDTLLVMPDHHFCLEETQKLINQPMEMSASFPGMTVSKQHFEPKEKYILKIDAFETRNKALNIDDDELEDTMNDMNHLTVNDPEASYLKSMLDILKPFRYNNNTAWYNVVAALVSTSDRYIPLAKWFSQKSERYTEDGFQKAIDNARNNAKKSILNSDNIIFWARKDNKEKFDKINEDGCFMKLLKYVYDAIIEGRVGQVHFAEIATMSVKNKYITDYKGADRQRLWYEFKFPEDKMKRGQAYKWVEIASPDALDRYLHTKLHNLNIKMVTFLKKKLDGEKDKDLLLYNKTVLKNFKASSRCLWTDAYKASVLRQMERMLASPGFIDSLDKDQMSMGVAQGVLILSPFGYKPKLLKSFHSLRISRYTDTAYVEFDPKDPITRKLLKAYRSMFPDNETDAFEYYMGAHAASIDYRPRPTIIFLITGGGANGKSRFEEMHAAALGEQYCTPMPIQMLLQGKEGDGEGPKSFLMKLEAARSAYYEEGPTLATLYMPMVKRITGCATLPGRDLREKARTIQSRCLHFVLSNHDFEILTFEEAVMRRIRYILLKITFKDALEYNPENLTHRLADASFDANMHNNPEYKSRYLSIMTFFHMKLLSLHDGKIDNIPHPTVDKDTLNFRNRQDHLNRFITTRIVKRVELDEKDDDDRDITAIENVADEYTRWYEKNVKQAKHYKSDIIKQIKDSALKDFIETTKHGDYLKADYRVLPTGEFPAEGEVLLHKVDKSGKTKKYSMVFKDETPDEALTRFEKEWKLLCDADAKQTKKGIDMQETFDDASDDEESKEVNVPQKYQIDHDNEFNNEVKKLDKEIRGRKVDEMAFSDDDYDNPASDSETEQDLQGKVKKIFNKSGDNIINKNEYVTDKSLKLLLNYYD